MDSQPAVFPANLPTDVTNSLLALNRLREQRRAAEDAVKPGEFVKLQNMQNRPELNGRRGIVCGISMLGTIKVLMDNTNEQLAVPLDRVVKTGAILIRGT